MAAMRDAALEYFGGPNDGEPVQWPPPRSAPPATTPPPPLNRVDDPNVPHYIRVRSGSYKFNSVTKRYEWIG